MSVFKNHVTVKTSSTNRAFKFIPEFTTTELHQQRLMLQAA